MTAKDDDLVVRIKQALKVVIDPELGHNIVDLGFIYDVSVDDGVAHITMTATTRGCPAASFLREGVANSACLVPGVDSVDVTMTFEPPWHPSMISPGVKASLGFAEVN
ncbi:aromatic ring hydroxylase [Bradyrhizobium forestalis]|uniref:Aromatic ring hydroxylase n=1 Tax=Bradyrhizobium forestalis TaxID=1419263 RepID=A0A2M8R960_9BRAD|nr:metal-sulfur cluster assembly factor [Bradyrhizobium forestalis]PJG54356.1 aromatic ring hydroxylase [Bradyrhizobium forestalis]